MAAMDKRYLRIKERLLDRALDLWGIEDERQLDPVVDLLLEAVAFESFQLEETLARADAALLGRLSRLLIPQKWMLPRPAHGLLSVHPKSGEHLMELSPHDHFSVNRVVQGVKSPPLFFTPLYATQLLDAQIRYRLWGTQLEELGRRRCYTEQAFAEEDRLGDHTLYLGIQIAEENLVHTDRLRLAILPERGELLPFLSEIQAFDACEHPLVIQSQNIPEASYEGHYVQDLKEHYCHYLYEIELRESKASCSLTSLFPKLKEELHELHDVASQLYWIRLEFPAVFTLDDMASMGVHLNTVPVINRRLIRKLHSLEREGRILSLSTSDQGHFLSIESLEDNLGKVYIPRERSYEAGALGVYSLYFGDLERFDASDAQRQLRRVLQLVREEGNAFSAVDNSSFASVLKELQDRLKTLEKTVGKMQSESGPSKAFLMTMPEAEAEHLALSYWESTGGLANGLSPQDIIQSLEPDKFDSASIRLRTKTKGGRAAETEDMLIAHLRYGLLSKERIVTREDVKSYLKHRLGITLKQVDLRDGVTISQESNKGLVRCTDVFLELVKQGTELNEEEQAHLSSRLETELKERSVAHTTYKVRFV